MPKYFAIITWEMIQAGRPPMSEIMITHGGSVQLFAILRPTITFSTTPLQRGKAGAQGQVMRALQRRGARGVVVEDARQQQVTREGRSTPCGGAESAADLMANGQKGASTMRVGMQLELKK